MRDLEQAAKELERARDKVASAKKAIGVEPDYCGDSNTLLRMSLDSMWEDLHSYDYELRQQAKEQSNAN